MDRLSIAVYCGEAEYVQALCSYFLQQEPWNLVVGFTEEENLCAYCREEKTDVLLAEEELLSPEVELLPVHTLILLSREPSGETGGRRSLKEPGRGGPAEGKTVKGQRRIYRCQAADEILRQVHFLHEMPDRPGTDGKFSETICVYSPAKDPGQTVFAWEAARYLAGERKVLYVGIGENAGFSDYFQVTFRRDLSDLLYLFRGYDGSFSNLLQSCVCERDGVYFIPPMEQPLDLLLTDKMEWQALLQSLSGRSGYDLVIFDIGVMFPAFWEALSLGDTICLPVRRGAYAGARQRQFYRLLKQQDVSLESRVSQIFLPENMESMEGKGFVRSLFRQEVQHGERTSAEQDPQGTSGEHGPFEGFE